MIEIDAYYARRKVEPCKNVGKPWELHKRLEVGEYVQVIGNAETPYIDPGNVCYTAVADIGWDHSDVITEKLFSIYFEAVTDDEGLGLIKLAEMDN